MSEHEIGGAIVRMPGPDGAQAVLTSERAGRPYRHPGRFKRMNLLWPSAELLGEEADLVTVYRLGLSKAEWNPSDIPDLLKLDPSRTCTQERHPHIPQPHFTKYAHLYSLDLNTPATLIEFAAVLQLVSNFRKEENRFTEGCSFFVAAVCSVMQASFDGSERRFDRDVQDHVPSPLSRLTTTTIARADGDLHPSSTKHILSGPYAPDDTPWRWFESRLTALSWIGRHELEVFQTIDCQSDVFKRMVDTLVRQVPAARDAHPATRWLRELESLQAEEKDVEMERQFHKRRREEAERALAEVKQAWEADKRAWEKEIRAWEEEKRAREEKSRAWEVEDRTSNCKSGQGSH
ncbi:hypothetical protein AAF712_005732 [Marasmius tenuissimus]|uniref:Uncharacterized protein n=1 Tax=Marasmius tenuissimus TaxID=585030 RepID=A0ABR3A1E6_9AGAR